MRSILTLPALALLGAAAPPTDPAPHVGGRVIADDGAWVFGWPGTYFESRFRGTAIGVRIEAPAEHMRLLVDGEEKMVLKRAGRGEILLGGLADGEHSVRLEKMTESQSGGGRFLGFFVPPGGALLPASARPRQIEFIGDSFTVGYGNTSASRTCTDREVHDTTDTQSAFGPLLAKRLDADYRINAYSGFGMVRNYNGTSRGLSLPAIYPRLKPDEAGHVEGSDPAWRPQVIVINLGTNDFSTALNPGEPWRDAEALKAAYRARYVGFVRELRARQPQARFVLMGSDLFFAEVERVAAAFGKADAGRIVTLRFDGLDYAGCHSHPSLADDRKLADLLAGTIGPLRP
ncbi:lipase [Sphingomonas parva]|uniref:Lipase n=1 Tax=Sphingomonas parva TaxID=2555898 RepID=A0A4Y8ZT80_9SPHN|nr:SGNH/GDSL hydrolase family protein [Sphingomonas parva]TFI57666.1 lipase [Sphingomonas parva]